MSTNVEYWRCMIITHDNGLHCEVRVSPEVLPQFLIHMARSGYYVQVQQAIQEERLVKASAGRGNSLDCYY